MALTKCIAPRLPQAQRWSEWIVGKTKRFRGFFLVNRLNLTGYNPGSPGSFRAAVTYRQRIQ